MTPQDTASGGLLAVEQRHRDAAALVHAREYGTATPEYLWLIEGEMDDSELVQVFARFERDHMANAELEPWIVWSNEHRAFWAPERCGYTLRIERAGRYTKAQAEEICNGANYRANSTIYEGTPPEICIPAPEAARPTPLVDGEMLEALKIAFEALKSGVGSMGAMQTVRAAIARAESAA